MRPYLQNASLVIALTGVLVVAPVPPPAEQLDHARQMNSLHQSIGVGALGRSIAAPRTSTVVHPVIDREGGDGENFDGARPYGNSRRASCNGRLAWSTSDGGGGGWGGRSRSIRAEDTAAFLAGGGRSSVGPAASAAAAAAAAEAAAAGTGSGGGAADGDSAVGDSDSGWAVTPTRHQSDRYDSIYGGCATDRLSSPAKSPRASIASSFFSVSSPPCNIIPPYNTGKRLSDNFISGGGSMAGGGGRDEQGGKRVIRLRPRLALRVGGMLLPRLLLLLLLLLRTGFGRVTMMRRIAVVIVEAEGADVGVGVDLMVRRRGGRGREGEAWAERGVEAERGLRAPTDRRCLLIFLRCCQAQRSLEGAVRL